VLLLSVMKNLRALGEVVAVRRYVLFSAAPLRRLRYRRRGKLTEEQEAVRCMDALEKLDHQEAKGLNLLGLLLGPLLFVVLIFLPGLEGLEGPARYAVAVTAWMAAWWVTEALPIAATALLPIVLFPMAGILPAGQV